MLPARTFSISVAMPWRALYEQIWRPEVFPRWAAGLAESDLHPAGDHWEAIGPDGPIRIRFTPHNDYGVMDHVVDTGEGAPVHVPLRVLENGEGAEVVLTLFRQPGMDEERFAADIKLINRDLKALKAMIERPGRG
ncbi:polyketide cyclase [Sphingobium nicotianae]|uniref:Polyketide cyclase n=1 Tax=Sphingobium nicotianae TaxID=2782607 RepID=A0A9X1IRX9_9SPHN|nr:polyketide cyclase [Sphingobium nicotianae]MBT2187966.1 polyketide cyclase [Sphingobium nicotianae]